MTHKILRSQAGLTVAEMMVTVLIFAFLSTGLFIFMHMLERQNTETQVKTKLMNEGRRALDKIVWGTRTGAAAQRYGVWEATAVALVNPSTLQFTDANGQVHTVRQNALKLESQMGVDPWKTLLDLNGNAADDPGSNTLALSFTAPQNDLLELQLVLGQRVRGRWTYVSLDTKVHLRNL